MKKITLVLALVTGLLIPGLALAQSAERVELSDAQMEELVLRSYPYVAMFNVNNKFALDATNPMNSGGYNRVKANTDLADHTVQAIARPNNDTLYVVAMVDVTKEPIVMEMPAFDSKYVSLMVTAYDHYVNIPMSAGDGDFDRPSTILFYSKRTPGYEGEPVKGVDKIFEVTGDFVSAVLRVMPHAAEPERLEANRAAMRSVDLEPLSEFLGKQDNDAHFVSWGSPPGIGRNLDLKEDMARFPDFGSDFEIFEDRFLEVMQFVVNHTTFDSDNELDSALLKILKPLGVEPGKEFDPDAVAVIGGAALREAAERFATESLAKMGDPEFLAANLTKTFQPKGKIGVELLAIQSVIGPIGQPAREALYPPVNTEDGKPMNAQSDYEIVMAPDAMPPAKAFWSVTLYDTENGFFIPNDRKKYSVGENAGFKLDENGGIRIVIAAEQPEGVPEENWLPIERKDIDLNVIMRIYSPDLEKFKNWEPPKAKRIESKTVTSEKSAERVGVNLTNFVRAESDHMIRANMKMAGAEFGKFTHLREPTTPGNQPVIRMNQDTLYSVTVLDLSKPVKITLPEVGGRYMSMHVVSQDHYMLVESKPGTHKLTEETVGTRFALVTIRTFYNAGDPEDLAKAHAAQDAIQTSGGGGGPFEAPNWNLDDLAKARKALSDLATLGFETTYAFGSKEEVRPIDHLVAAAAGWGGLPRTAAYYEMGSVEKNDGKTAYAVTVKDVPVDAFWSITVYNADGYLEANDLGRNSFNNSSATPNEDGSYTIRFGGDPKSDNYLPITKGWNYAIRMYQPRKEILDGTWTFPSIEPVK